MNVEDRLRTAWHAPGYALPTWPDASSRVRAGMVRRRRRRAVLTAFAAVLLALLVLPIVVVTRTSPQPTPATTPTATPGLGQVVPWVEDRLGPLPPANPKTTQACTTADLEAVSAAPAVVGSTATATVTVTNVSDSHCHLLGAVLRDHGELVAVGPDDGTAMVVAPGGAVMISVIARTACPGRAVTYVDLTIEAVPAEIPVPGLSLTSSCPLQLGQWFAHAADPDPWQQLSSYIDVPSSVSRGHDLSYVVTLSNPTPGPIELDPAPVFRQSLADSGGRYRLHLPFTTLPAGSWVRLRMQIPIPATTPLGATTLSWSIEAGTVQVAVTDTTVTVR
jgi:hypothetical protein